MAVHIWIWLDCGVLTSPPREKKNKAEIYIEKCHNVWHVYENKEEKVNIMRIKL